MRYYHIVSVHCRTGSLENFNDAIQSYFSVHCRTGSLESRRPTNETCIYVHCRTGSLEICCSLRIQ